jgi:hypothetical protein
VDRLVLISGIGILCRVFWVLDSCPNMMNVIISVAYVQDAVSNLM